MPMIIGVIVLLVIIGTPIAMYNSLVGLRQRFKNAFSQIDVQLKRRHDLIPNLVSTCKGYMKHEAETLEKVVQARAAAMGASGKGAAAMGKAESGLSGALKSLFAVVESYPNLKANENMLSLQEELTSTENKISFARQAYNDAVMAYNTKREVFPSNIIAGMFSFNKADLFELENPEEERKAPKVEF